MTAYFGLFDVGRIAAGETVVISSAAGAVGSVAGQIARLSGCKVIGIAGGADKCRYLIEELGFDGAVDYKQGDVYAQLKRLCPEGIDVYFDNVGGDMLDAAMLLLKKRARVVITGMLSQYKRPPVHRPRFYADALAPRAHEGSALRLRRPLSGSAGKIALVESGAVDPKDIVDGVEALADISDVVRWRSGEAAAAVGNANTEPIRCSAPTSPGSDAQARPARTTSYS